jgi:hypothetical protein
MSYAIERHQRCSLRLHSLKTGSGVGTSFLKRSSIQMARAFEYMARRRFVRQKALGSADAMQKVLYCMALSIVRGQIFTSREVAIIQRSLEGFERSLKIDFNADRPSYGSVRQVAHPNPR